MSQTVEVAILLIAVLLCGTLLVKETAVWVEIHHTARVGLHLGVKIQVYLVLRFNWSWYSVISIVAGLRGWRI